MKLTVHLPRHVAEKLHPNQFPPETCFISINEPSSNDGDSKLDSNWFKVLRTRFWDVTTPIDDWRGGSLDPITEEQAKEIADFIKENKDRSIFVHCRAGISRSAAVVKVLLELGWEFANKFPVHDLTGYNIKVYSLVKKQFPELLPIGA